MGILGKDLFHLTYEFFHFKVLFSNDDIEIEEKNYKHGEILTDFLNYDPTSFLEAVEEMKGLSCFCMVYHASFQQATIP